MLLTRLRLLKRQVIGYGYYIRETGPGRQLVEVLNRFNLKGAVIPFQRCLRCNGLLEPIDKVVVIERIPPKSGKLLMSFITVPSVVKSTGRGHTTNECDNTLRRCLALSRRVEGIGAHSSTNYAQVLNRHRL